MTYAYDNYVQLPVVDLYDTNVMKMAIDAARDMYDKGQDLIKDFYKTYGDFMSPFAKDMEAYGQMMGGVRDLINNAYANGIDLLKSPEGRMLISKAINSVDPGLFNLMRSNAKAGYEYLSQAAKLASQGKYSQELEDYISSLKGNVSFNDFSTLDNGTWNRMPTEYSTLLEYVHPSFAHLKPHLLTKEEAISRVGSEYDPRYEYSGIVREDMELAMRDALPGLVGNNLYGFYRELAKKLLLLAGNLNPTEELINKQFVNNAVTSDSQMMMPLDRSMSKDAEYQLKDIYDAKSDYREYYYDNLLKYDLNGDGKIDEKDDNIRLESSKSSRRKSGESGGDDDGGINYFQDQFDRGLQYFTYKDAGDPPQTDLQVKRNSKDVLIASMRDTKNLRNLQSYGKVGDDGSTQYKEWVKERDAFLSSHTAKGLLDRDVLIKSIKRPVDNSKTYCVYAAEGDINRLWSDDRVVSNTFGAKGKKGRIGEDGILDDFKTENGGGNIDNLKMLFTDLTYTAPITSKDGSVRMMQFQRVYLYKKLSDKSDKYIGSKWFALYESDPTKGVVKNKQRYYRGVSTTFSSEGSGETQSMSSEGEHLLHTTSSGTYNSQTRF